MHRSTAGHSRTTASRWTSPLAPGAGQAPDRGGARGNGRCGFQSGGLWRWRPAWPTKSVTGGCRGGAQHGIDRCRPDALLREPITQGGTIMPPKSYVIALEEHYQDGELKQHRGGGVAERLDDVGPLRLKEMDEAGIDLQVLSHANPGLQGVDAATGVPLARRINDRLR